MEHGSPYELSTDDESNHVAALEAANRCCGGDTDAGTLVHHYERCFAFGTTTPLWAGGRVENLVHLLPFPLPPELTLTPVRMVAIIHH